MEENSKYQDSLNSLKELAYYQKIDNIEKYYKVTKSNFLIENVYKLPLVEQKIILSIASLIHPLDEDFKTYVIKADIIAKVINYDKDHIYQYMIDMARNIMQKPITYHDKQRNETIVISWFSVFIYRHDRGEIAVRFDKILKPHLLNLKKKFTTFKLGYAVNLRSIFSITLYQLFKKIEGEQKGKKIKRCIFSLIDLRKYLNVENKYTSYNMFKNRVILVAQKELKLKTDIIFNFKEIKTGRKIDRIEFTIRENKKNKIKDDTKDLFQLNDIGYELIKLGIAMDDAKELIDITSTEEIEWKINQYLYIKENYPKKIRDDVKYIYNSIKKQNWKEVEYLDYLKEKEIEEIEKEREKERIIELKEERIKQAYEKYCNSLCKPYEGLECREQKQIDKHVNVKIKEDKIFAKLNTEGQKVHIKTLQKMAIRELNTNILSFEEWFDKNEK